MPRPTPPSQASLILKGPDGAPPPPPPAWNHWEPTGGKVLHTASPNLASALKKALKEFMAVTLCICLCACACRLCVSLSGSIDLEFVPCCM